jgi:quaternary ammonium compound-resistance protein SugE
MHSIRDTEAQAERIGMNMRTTSPVKGKPARTTWLEAREVFAMAWVYLFVAGLLEVLWAYTMKQSMGFTKLVPSIVTIVAMIASFGLLSFSMRVLPLGTAYVIWTGIGAIGAFVVGIAVLGEQVTALRVGSALFILIGLVGLKMASDR